MAIATATMSDKQATPYRRKKLRIVSKRRRRIENALVAYSFIAPNFLGFAIFTLGPILFAFALAFMHWDGSNAMRFAGLDNFWRLFEDRAFIAAFWNTVIYTVASVPAWMRSRERTPPIPTQVASAPLALAALTVGTIQVPETAV